MLPHREKRKRPEQDVCAERQRAVRQAPHGLHHCGAEGRVHLPHERAFPQEGKPERPEDAHGTRQDHHVQGKRTLFHEVRLHFPSAGNPQRSFNRKVVHRSHRHQLEFAPEKVMVV